MLAILAITRTTIEEAAIYNKEAALMLDRAASLLLWIFTAVENLFAGSVSAVILQNMPKDF